MPFSGRMLRLPMGEVPRPYLAGVTDFLMAGVAFDPAGLRAILPRGIDPAPGGWGIVTLYDAPSGTAPAPYAKAYVAAAVQGADNPDGSPAMFLLAHLGTPGLVAALSDGCRLMSPARIRIEGRGPERSAEAVEPDGTAIRLSLRRKEGVAPSQNSGVHNYVMVDRQGRLRLTPVTYVASYEGAELRALDLPGATAGGWPLPRLRSVLWAKYAMRMRLSFAADEPFEPRALADDRTRAAEAFLAVLSRMGHVAALCLPDGRPVAAAPGLAGTLAGQGTLARPPGAGPAPLAVPDGPDGARRIARALPVPAAVLGFDCLLVLVADPARPAPGAAAVLRMFGLTPAEARLAEALGGGATLDAAAGALGITANTARSTLKQVFAKLGIGRQAELVRLVAQLGA